MTKSSLREYLDTGKSYGRVLPEVSKWMLRQPLEYRSTDWLHPSEISAHDWCHRESWFLLNGAKAVRKRPNLQLQNIFDEGHEIHAKWQKRFERMGTLYGKWSDDPQWELAPEGGFADRNYHEVPLEWPEMRVHGHADGWLVGFGSDLLLEIKSIGTGTVRLYNPSLLRNSLAETFSQIRSPFSGHIRQASIYIAILNSMYERGEIDRKPPTEMLFIYECKENQAIKEFVVSYDYSTVEEIFTNAQKILDSLDPLDCNIAAGGCKKCLPYTEVPSVD